MQSCCLRSHPKDPVLFLPTDFVNWVCGDLLGIGKKVVRKDTDFLHKYLTRIVQSRTKEIGDGLLSIRQIPRAILPFSISKTHFVSAHTL